MKLPLSIAVCGALLTANAWGQLSGQTDEPSVSPALSTKLHPIPAPPTTDPLPTEMEKLFSAMEKAAAASADVFRPMTARQLNHRPANGSHTPRWNVEHMAGRQLQFFSQIFHAVEPKIPVVDLNPKQMPEDYEAAHADWDGKQEAALIKSVSEYCRRYAPLIADLDLDAKPPAGRWPTLRALLVTMDKHYKQHTANVVEKTKSDDWPQA